MIYSNDLGRKQLENDKQIYMYDGDIHVQSHTKLIKHKLPAGLSRCWSVCMFGHVRIYQKLMTMRQQTNWYIMITYCQVLVPFLQQEVTTWTIQHQALHWVSLKSINAYIRCRFYPKMTKYIRKKDMGLLNVHYKVSNKSSKGEYQLNYQLFWFNNCYEAHHRVRVR